MRSEDNSNRSRSLDGAQLEELTQIMQQHRRWLVDAVRRRMDPRLAQRVDAEDIVNEAYIVARRRWLTYLRQRQMSPRAWLYMIAKNCLVGQWRRYTRKKREIHREMPIPDRSSVQLGVSLVSKTKSPSQKLVQRELESQVRQVMQALSDTDRDILMMHHAEDLSYREIAEILSITTNAATLRYAKALVRLRSEWKKAQGKVE